MIRVARCALSLSLCAALMVSAAWAQRATDLRGIPGGAFRPFYRLAGRDTVTVRPFALEAEPVTNARFLAFVRAHPAWRRAFWRTADRDAACLHHEPAARRMGHAALADRRG